MIPANTATTLRESTPCPAPRKHRSRFILAACLGVAAISTLTVATPAHALDEPATSAPTTEPTDPAPDRITHITVSPLEALPGGQVHVTGECTYKGTPATSVLLSLVSRVADDYRGFDGPIDAATGLIDAEVTIPHDVPPGMYEFGWMCVLSDMAFGANDEKVLFTILDPGTNSAEPTPTATPTPQQTAATPISPTTTAAADELADTGASTSSGLIATAGLAVAGFAALLTHRLRSRRRPS